MQYPKNIYWYLLFFSTLLGAYSKETHDWYASFYQSLAEQDIKSIRYFQIWVAPGKTSPQDALAIGGNQENFELWLQTAQEFIGSKDFYRQIWEGDFFYEITVDKNVYEKHEALFEELKAKYGRSFDVSLIEDYQPQKVDSPMHIGYDQCVCGVASVCSDYWRFAHSQKEEVEINIYADIDTLSQAITTKKGHSHEKFGLGMHQSSGIYVPFFWTPGQLHWNTDMLIFHNVTKKSYQQIQALFQETLKEQALAFEYILKQQSTFKNIKSYEEYWDDLERRLTLFLTQPHVALNRYQLILFGIGPGFWLAMTQQELATPYWHGASDNVDNYFSWVLADIEKSYERVDSALLDTLYTEEDKVNIIKMILLLYDRAYLKKNKVDWYALFEAGFREEILKHQKLLRELPAQLNFLKKSTQFCLTG